ncbi:hypothetical protein [Larsenimonas rhizosphaerae]|uniref:Phage tail protein n=1 Tax=Larsenimonas rhizosphaerae TaxID=2944682 RepID=A0AA41ZQI0_9GAMM|nr:hypothetical protein [Larsenimonas rhizosphaerae]MCX2525495.1 hypothetical protein [Larsenimonas rhizosphaerae]
MTYYYAASTGCFYRDTHPNIPRDAISIATEKRDELIAAQARGLQITPDEKGIPNAIALDFSITRQRQNALDAIDAAADRARAADRSTGQYLDAEYRLVQSALEQWRTRDSDDAPVPLAIQDWADAQGITPNKAAEQIAEAAARAEELLQAVRRIRLASKAAIRDVSDDADFMEVARPCIDQLNFLTKTAH